MVGIRAQCESNPSWPANQSALEIWSFAGEKKMWHRLSFTEKLAGSLRSYDEIGHQVATPVQFNIDSEILK